MGFRCMVSHGKWLNLVPVFKSSTWLMRGQDRSWQESLATAAAQAKDGDRGVKDHARELRGRSACVQMWAAGTGGTGAELHISVWAEGETIS